jgi:hypothetical protein
MPPICTLFCSGCAPSHVGRVGFLRTTSVSGPGQNLSANARVWSETSSAISSNWLLSAICKIKGLSPGRFFAAYTFATASALKASAPKPYTVSVGNATKPPDLITSAACWIPLWSAGITRMVI